MSMFALSGMTIIQTNLPDKLCLLGLVEEIQKKRTKNPKSAQSSIVPFDHEAPQASMSFPPRLVICKLVLMVR